eukprot:TRINITY_DN1649_c0_g5_i1.p1 TRINITY_DN1649_c0_g5~~TRINITY_DN1649_c0_g5_i1.p1  ORF type:complete len:713 (-),score=157.35 TRINITY_DN1649_c0_g5_i1:72-2210(-)
MQFVSVGIWRALQGVGMPMSLNDVCVFTPAWFGVLTTAFLGLLTAECSGSTDAGIIAAVIMSMIPAHIMRSVAGAYDNECVAMCFFCATLYFWCRALRTQTSWFWGIPAGVAYFALVASWGGYVYVINIIGVHVVVLVLIGRYSRNLHLAYSLLYVLGVALAVQVPVVGWTPLRSLEQMGPLVVFCVLQALALCSVLRRLKPMREADFNNLRLLVLAAFGITLAAVAAELFRQGFFAPVSARVRGLFVKHTRTGNPLVDSVAEHQATSPRAYWMYFYYTCYIAPIGFALLLRDATDAKLFLSLYAGVTYYFSAKMNRLILLLGPAASALGGIAVSFLLHLAWSQFRVADEPTEHEKQQPQAPREAEQAETLSEKTSKKEDEESKSDERQSQPKQRAKKKAAAAKAAATTKQPSSQAPVQEQLSLEEDLLAGVPNEIRMLGAAVVLVVLSALGSDFYRYCHGIAEAMSSPDIIFSKRQKDGSVKVYHDYMEAYGWLREHTPEDSRVMAWWDYGYQISGVANRTTIADGNTWNHEHIATLGRCLVSPEDKAHELVRHLADYVLLWTGLRGGDDVAKSPHMARIANSVYSDLCPDDPRCTQFGFDKDGTPSAMMRESLLWRLHQHELEQEDGEETVRVDPSRFREAYTSKNGLVRIFAVVNVSTESRAWATSGDGRRCDAPGSWYCPGSYPKELEALLANKKAFRQLEDFNAKPT